MRFDRWLWLLSCVFLSVSAASVLWYKQHHCPPGTNHVPVLSQALFEAPFYAREITVLVLLGAAVLAAYYRDAISTGLALMWLLGFLNRDNDDIHLFYVIAAASATLLTILLSRHVSSAWKWSTGLVFFAFATVYLIVTPCHLSAFYLLEYAAILLLACSAAVRTRAFTAAHQVPSQRKEGTI